MNLDLIFEHIPILKQLPDFSSCRVFGTYPGFETIAGFQLSRVFGTYPGFEIITGILINVNYQVFTHL